MKLSFALFYHSLVSDWNHGNAHFLRGVVMELLARGHRVRVYEPEDGWSRENLIRDHGKEAVAEFERAFPQLSTTFYKLDKFDLDAALGNADIAIVHEWSDPALVAAVGKARLRFPSLRAFFHDTHHRAITAPEEIGRFDLSGYDGVLAYGASLRDAYLGLGWGKDVHVWHEAADIRTFYPRPSRRPSRQKSGDVVWIGNWGDDERTEELREFFMQPVSNLRLQAQVYGVRYPDHARSALQNAGIEYCGWLPNYRAPEVFANFRVTVHVPRRPYTAQLPGIPTIRPFEALACGIPLISAPWSDSEGLFRANRDFLMVRSGAEMEKALYDVLHDPELAESLARHGLETIRSHHTCGHRVDQLTAIYEAVRPRRHAQPDFAAAEVSS
jgi:spore maturation protein CgeB